MYKYFLTLFFTLMIIFTGSAQASSKNVIYVYADEGVSKESLSHTIYSLKKAVKSSFSIQKINAKQVKHGEWQRNALLFVMPGGADLAYQKKLHGVGNKNIRVYVQHGGAYLGICAGGYYASGRVVFAPGTKLEVVGDRELSLYPATAYGPAFNDFDYATHHGTHAAEITWQLDSPFKKGQSFTVYYKGGAYFSDVNAPSDAEVLARYCDVTAQPPAIVKTHFGNGSVVLTGVHVEYDYHLLDEKDPYLVDVIKALKISDKSRVALWHELLHDVGVLSANNTT